MAKQLTTIDKLREEQKQDRREIAEKDREIKNLKRKLTRAEEARDVWKRAAQAVGARRELGKR